jgi:hypothetical protein
MTFVPSDAPTLAAFVLLAAGMLVVVLTVLRRAGAHPGVVIGFLAYLGVLAGATLSGAARAHVIPFVPILFATVVAGAVWLAASRLGGRIAATYSLAAILGLQAFRLALELVLHRWAATGTVPPTMTWTGQNLDVIAGAAALVAIPWLNQHRAVAWTVQLVGLALLVNAVRVVVLSSPFPFAWPLERPLQLALYFPYVLIGPLMVGVALAGHLVAFRALLGETRLPRRSRRGTAEPRSQRGERAG